MIKAQELRLGNWVLFDVEEVYEQITARRIGFISQANSKGHIHPFKPIPLTEDILLKCGFDKSSDGEHFFIGHFGFCLVYDGHDFCMKPRIIDDLVIAYSRHLHQLQNLYHALTGEELQINL